jgi:acyl-coenzyme A synthetase/AMP-(fatty) acid ligase
LAPGARITEKVLAADMGLSVSPLRGALTRLDHEGLVRTLPRKGYQVAPAELESLLLTHPEVRDAAVVGMPHAEGGEAPKAFVVSSAPLDPDDLMTWVAERVAPYKKVRAVEFVSEVPRSAAGKILRRLLK